MKTVHVGILGLGTVGSGTAETLLQQAGILAARTGMDLKLVKAADLHLERKGSRGLPPEILTHDAMAVVQDPDVQIVVELIGGTTVAKELILEALRQGKSVVTANKALLAECGPELFAAAEASGSDLFYEAAVAGGIPILKALREGLVANPIQRIRGILNGTCNYILTRMEREGIAFEDVLRQAQDLGYAEADPELDVDGWDTAHKAVILCRMAFGVPLALSDVPVEGIRTIDPVDVRYASMLGYRIKLLAMLDRHDKGFSVSVQPVLIPQNHLMGGVDLTFNAVLVDGEVVDQTLYYGKGAGKFPTASAVVADIVDAARNVAGDAQNRIPLSWATDQSLEWVPVEDRCERSYFRLSLLDRPGSLAKVTQVLGNHGISINSLIQHELDKEQLFVPVVFITGEARLGNIHQAMQALSALPEVEPQITRYRLEELGS